MNGRSRVVPAVCFLLAFLAVGIPYWRIPYSEVNLPDALLGAGLVVVVFAAVVLRVRTHGSFGQAVFAGLMVPAAVMTRVVVDAVGDPTSHNLWPFEIAIATGVGLLAALSGALVGSLSARFLRAGAADNQT